MFATLDFENGSFTFAIKSWSDFGPHLSLAQSLAAGSDYPPVHPFVPTETVRYHFLFWFLSANLSYLGLNLAWGVNILSILSLLALLILITTYAEMLFNSRAVGRISVVLFFLASSSLSYIPFLFSQDSISGAVSAISSQHDFLRSGFPYRGADWGALSVAVFANQRHLLSAVGLVLIVLIYLVELYRKKGAIGVLPRRPDLSAPQDETQTFPSTSPTTKISQDLGPLIFCGLLLGALPYWNSAVFVAGSLIVGGLFLAFPKRQYLAVLIAVVVVLALPQLLLLRAGNIGPSGHSFFVFGYIVTEPTFANLLEYLLWTFGFKWLLIFLGLFLVPVDYRKLLLALSVPFFVAFAFQLSVEVFNNHKLLNTWHVFAATYVAYALWTIGRGTVFRRSLAVVLAAVMVFGAVIDLFPIHNDGAITVPHNGDRLTAWLTENTSPNDIFLSDRYISHPILFSGRKIFLGNTLFLWTAGYDLAEREKAQVKMLTTRDVNELKRFLSKYKIAYIAIDDGLRSNNAFRGLNEDLIHKNFRIVFNDLERVYGNLKIYRVE